MTQSGSTGRSWRQARLALEHFGRGVDWEMGRLASRFTGRFGWAGWALSLCAVLSALALSVGQQQAEQLTALQVQSQSRQMTPAAPLPSVPGPLPEEASLQAFEDSLPLYENTPEVVQALLDFAEAERLVIQRGEYLAQPDLAGGFLRYRITWPVKGSAPAIYRFLQASLRAHRTLSLESIQLRRDRVDAPTIEARIQWVLLTRRPRTHEGKP